MFARPATSEPPLDLVLRWGVLLYLPITVMTLPKSVIESIEDIAHYLKLIAKELKQINEREEAKIRGKEESYIYADNDESFP